MNAADFASSACRSGESDPGLERVVVIEPQDGEPVVLNPGDRRLEPIALEARCARLGGGDTLLPPTERRLLARLDPCGDNRGDGGRQCPATPVAHQVHVVHADQKALCFGQQGLAALTMQPGHGIRLHREALQNNPVRLARRVRRHHRLLKETGLLRHGSADAGLPIAERGGLPFPRAGLDDDGDRCLRRGCHATPPSSP